MPKIRKTKLNAGAAEPKIKDFLDMIAPGIIKFNTMAYAEVKSSD